MSFSPFLTSLARVLPPVTTVNFAKTVAPCLYFQMLANPFMSGLGVISSLVLNAVVIMRLDPTPSAPDGLFFLKGDSTTPGFGVLYNLGSDGNVNGTVKAFFSFPARWTWDFFSFVLGSKFSLGIRRSCLIFQSCVKYRVAAPNFSRPLPRDSLWSSHHVVSAMRNELGSLL